MSVFIINLQSALDKSKAFYIIEDTDETEVTNRIKTFFYDYDEPLSFDELSDETEVIMEAVAADRINDIANRVCEYIQNRGRDYSSLLAIEKAKIFGFKMNDSDYNLKLYSAVIKKFGVPLVRKAQFDDYQAIYDAGIIRTKEGKEIGRGR